MKNILTFLIVTLLPIKAIGQIYNTEKLDIKKLNIHGIPRQVVIREKSLCSDNDIIIERLFFDTTGCCIESIKSSNGSKTTVVKYNYQQGKLNCKTQIEHIGLISDTLIDKYIYTDEGSLTQKTNYHMKNGKLKITGYTTYEVDSVDSKTVLATYYLYIGEEHGIAKYRKYLDRFCFNSNNQIEYFNSNGLDYKIYYDSVTLEKKTFQCFEQDSSVISIQKYDKYGNEIEHITNIQCSKDYFTIKKNKDSLKNTFIKKCIKKCELMISKRNEHSPIQNAIYSFYNYDKLKNVKEKFTFDSCSGSMYYTTYEYVF